MVEKSPFLVGQLLLAMPTLGDPRFHHAVIYMCAHDENGAMGLVINHTMQGLDFGDLLERIRIGTGEKSVLSELDIPVFGGGPVEPTRGFLLHSAEFSQPDTIKIDDRFSVTGTVDALKAIAGGRGPQKMLFLLGYAGWGAGQLDNEMQLNAWLTVESSPDLVFETRPEEKWEKALKTIGVSPSMLSGTAGRA